MFHLEERIIHLVSLSKYWIRFEGRDQVGVGPSIGPTLGAIPDSPERPFV